MSVTTELQGSTYRVSGEYNDLTIAGSYIVSQDKTLETMNLTAAADEKTIVGTLTYNNSRLNIHSSDYKNSQDVIDGLYPVFKKVIAELGM